MTRRNAESVGSNLSRRAFLLSGALATIGLAGCSAGNGSTSDDSSSSSATSKSIGTNPKDLSALTLDSTAWSYDSGNDVYYQIGVQYCASPAATAYESMAIYVPGAYFTGTKNDDGTYTCKVKSSASVGSYTATTAPVVIPVNTAGYSAQEAPTSYNANGLTDYLKAGLVYVYPGCRGRNNGTNSDGSTFAGGAPWGVTDLKAAVRCLRYNASAIPGGAERVFTFGHSGGGAQSALMGATGDSTLYVPYLESIGAVFSDASGKAISDAITGAMCWCPITSLDIANESYEWMMGQFSTSGTRADGTWTALFSKDLAKRFARYVNDLGLEDGKGNVLKLQKGGEGLYTSGSYYDEVQDAIEKSLNNFLSDTEFPYTSSSQTMADGGFAGGGSGGAPDVSGSTGAPSGEAPSGEAPSGATGGAPSGSTQGAPSGEAPQASAGGSSTSSDSTTYQTAQEYVDSLNSDTTWVSYDSSTNKATITSVGEFVKHCKTASKDVGAFDALDRSQAENYLFGNAKTDNLHFDAIMASLLKGSKDDYAACSGFDESYVSAYADDMGNTDDLGTKTSVRQRMYNPMYFIARGLGGYGKATAAEHWRIRTGIDQGDTSLTTELNLALALKANKAVKDVDFATVWGQGHTTAERTGSSGANFISWVKDCCS
ncbi:MAG: tannase [Olsenella umbonata]|nr:tannase [Parafannyhessea umbonata]